jgi:hypothetical protein
MACSVSSHVLNTVLGTGKRCAATTLGMRDRCGKVAVG